MHDTRSKHPNLVTLVPTRRLLPMCGVDLMRGLLAFLPLPIFTRQKKLVCTAGIHSIVVPFGDAYGELLVGTVGYTYCTYRLYVANCPFLACTLVQKKR